MLKLVSKLLSKASESFFRRGALQSIPTSTSVNSSSHELMDSERKDIQPFIEVNTIEDDIEHKQIEPTSTSLAPTSLASTNQVEIFSKIVSVKPNIPAITPVHPVFTFKPKTFHTSKRVRSSLFRDVSSLKYADLMSAQQRRSNRLLKKTQSPKIKYKVYRG
ncbi:hypothetical protein RCL1_003277 [Eukaryota sp. TZLM3-RCL]